MRTLALLSLLAVASITHAQTPAGANAALGYWRAFSLVNAPEADDAVWKTADDIANGRAPWGDPGVAALVDGNAGAYLEMHKASLKPSCDFGLAFEDGFSMILPHLAKVRQLSTLNLLRAAQAEAQGKGEEAVEAWLDGARMARHLAQDPVLISHLVASMILSRHIEALIRFVSSGAAGKAERTSIAGAIGALPAYGWDWGAAIRMEKECAGGVVKTCLEAKNPKEALLSFVGAVEPADGKGSGKPDPDAMLKDWGATEDVLADASKFRDYIRGCADGYDALMDSVAEALRKPWWEGQPTLEKLSEKPKGDNLLIGMLAPSTAAIGRNRAQLEVQRAGLLALVAVAQHRADKGSDPATVDGLGVPADPYSGKALTLEASKEGLVIRSEGKNSDGKRFEFVLKK
jgi:hypothetical protein